MRGEPFLHPAAMRALVRDFVERARAGEPGPEEPLTLRESEIVKLIAEGWSNRRIAEELVIAEKTVEGHRSRIFEKLGLHDRVALTRWAVRKGLVEP
jgi:DNA-binding NarL/FixJ family response regulator